MAWFNELKRYFKIETRWINNGIVDSLLADYSVRLEAIAERDPTGRIHAQNFDLEREVADGLIAAIRTEVWHEYYYLAEDLVAEAREAIDGFFQVRNKK